MKIIPPRFEFVLLALSVAWVVASVFISYHKRDWMWFDRAGAILCFASAALPLASLLRSSSEEYAKENPGSFGFVSATDWPPKKAILSAKITRLSFWLGGIGTVIWAYGDWIGVQIHSFSP